MSEQSREPAGESKLGPEHIEPEKDPDLKTVKELADEIFGQQVGQSKKGPTQWFKWFEADRNHIEIILDQNSLIEQEIAGIKEQLIHITPGNIKDAVGKTINDHLENILSQSKLIKSEVTQIEERFRGKPFAQKREDEERTRGIEERKGKGFQV